MTYLEEIKKSMKLLADNGYYIIGQNTRYGGTSMFHTLKDFPDEMKIELPVFEDIQAGIATGMTLEGLKVCSIYPRFDFFILAINQIINHLDKAKEMSDGQFNPNPIFRVCVGSVKPMMPGPQHSNNYTEAIKSMVTNIDVVELLKAEDVYPAYEKAVTSNRATILIEHSDLYNAEVKEDIRKSKEQ